MNVENNGKTFFKRLYRSKITKTRLVGTLLNVTMSKYTCGNAPTNLEILCV